MSARPVGAWFLVVAGIAVVATLAAAIAVIGSPARQRAQRFDERRVSELAAIAAAVERYESTEKRLPARLADLEPDAIGTRAHADPASGRPYEYRVVDARHYELCAEFALARARDEPAAPYVDEDWVHPAGHHCFRRAVPVSDAAKAQAEAAADAAVAAASDVAD